jgi:hypothetical protein
MPPLLGQRGPLLLPTVSPRFLPVCSPEDLRNLRPGWTPMWPLAAIWKIALFHHPKPIEYQFQEGQKREIQREPRLSLLFVTADGPDRGLFDWPGQLSGRFSGQNRPWPFPFPHLPDLKPSRPSLPGPNGLEIRKASWCSDTVWRGMISDMDSTSRVPGLPQD